MKMPEQSTKGTDPPGKQLKLTPQKQQQNQTQMITQKPTHGQKSKEMPRQQIQKQQETSNQRNQGPPTKMKYLQVKIRATKQDKNSGRRKEPAKNPTKTMDQKSRQKFNNVRWPS